MSIDVLNTISLAVALLLAHRNLRMPRWRELTPGLRLTAGAAFGVALASSQWPLAMLFAGLVGYELYAERLGITPGGNLLR